MFRDFSHLEVLNRVPKSQLRYFACDCANHVMGIFESAMPGDMRPRSAIETARRYASGKASELELRQASNDAETAAWESGDKAWVDGIPLPAVDAAASAAITAEACCVEDALDAATFAAKAAIEAVEVAAVGSEIANLVWTNSLQEVSDVEIHAFASAREAETAWQRARIEHYIQQKA